MSWLACEGQRLTDAISDLLPPRRSQRSNPGCRPGVQAVLPTQPSCQLTALGFSFCNLNILKTRSMGPEWTPFRAVRKDFTKGKALKTFKLRRSIQNLCVSGPGMRKRCWGQVGVSKWELIGSFVPPGSNCKEGILRAYCVSCPVPWMLSILLQGTDAPLEFKCYLSKLKNLDTANVSRTDVWLLPLILWHLQTQRS